MDQHSSTVQHAPVLNVMTSLVMAAHRVDGAMGTYRESVDMISTSSYTALPMLVDMGKHLLTVAAANKSSAKEEQQKPQAVHVVMVGACFPVNTLPWATVSMQHVHCLAQALKGQLTCKHGSECWQLLGVRRALLGMRQACAEFGLSQPGGP
jgi:hypothetical protein